MTPTRLSTVIMSSSIYDYGFVTFQVLVYLAMGALLFGVEIDRQHLRRRWSFSSSPSSP